MTSTYIHVLNPGTYTSIQYTQRFTEIQFGVPMGGPCDQYSAAIGKWLVGQNADHPVLEFSGTGPTLQFEGKCQLAITGSSMEAILNDQKNLPHYTLLDIKDGSIIKFSNAISGYRTYLAINGTILNPLKQLTSHRLLKNQSIEINTHFERGGKTIADELIPYATESTIVRYIRGPESDSPTELEEITTRSFTISTQSNRMGIKVLEKLHHNTPKNEMISSGVIPGTIQVTNDNSIIILLNDAQTTGGYPRIGNVISADLDLLGQAAPGTKISFQEVDHDAAHRALMLYKENLSYFVN